MNTNIIPEKTNQALQIFGVKANNFNCVEHRAYRGDNIMKKVTGDTIQFESRYELREIIESLNKQIEKSKEELPHSQDLVELLDAMYMNW